MHAVIKDAIRTLSLDTTLEQHKTIDVSVVDPLATKQALHVKSIFTSNTIWQDIS